MHKKTKIFIITMTFIMLFAACNVVENEPVIAETQEPIIVDRLKASTEPVMAVEKKELISKKDMELLALLTMAEAEGEPEDGQRLVIDTVLNRVDSEHFPDTIYDVIWQKNQFTPMLNGRIERCEVRDDICKLIIEELKCRNNYDVIFFNATHYSKYGVPLFQTGNHYFSSYD